MDKKQLIEISTECLQYANELAKDSGVPGIGLIGYFTQHFFDMYLRSRFQEFVDAVGIDVEFLNKIVSDENYSNCLYSALESVRRTHSKIGLAVIAMIYKDHWNNPDFLTPAMRAFAEISDKTISSFIKLYESIPKDEKLLKLEVYRDGVGFFHPNYNDAVELINRGFFVQTCGFPGGGNLPIQGMLCDCTNAYYQYCKNAVVVVNK